MYLYVCKHTREKFHFDVFIQWNTLNIYYYYKLQIEVKYYGTMIAAINLLPYDIIAHFILDSF